VELERLVLNSDRNSMIRRCNLNKRNFSTLGLLVVALLLVLTPILSCAAPEPAPPAPAEVVKPDKVIIYHFGDLSGPYAPITAPIVAGLGDCMEWYNAELGGIDGVPLGQKFRDTANKLDAALAAYSAFKESDPYPIVEVLYGSAESEALRDRLVEDKIVSITAGLSPKALYPPGYQFAMGPSYCDSMGAWIDWVTEDWAKKTGETVKLAILTWDSPFGKAIMVDELRDYAASKGVDIVYEGVYGLRDLDVSTQLTAIKGTGANWVYDNTAAHGPKVIHAAAAGLGMLNHDLYDTTPGMIHRACGPWAMDESSVILSGELADGLVGPRAFASWAMPEVEGVAKAIAAADAHDRGSHERVMGYIASWGVGYTLFYCIDKAVEEVGWDNLSGEALRDQLLKLDDFSPLGLAKFTFTADKMEPRQVRIFQAEGGKLLPITDWVTCPDLRPYDYR